MPKSVDKIIFLQKKFTDLNQQLMLLSQMNEKAIELKTNNAKVSAKNALTANDNSRNLVLFNCIKLYI